jgi:hypothetical protein
MKSILESLLFLHYLISNKLFHEKNLAFQFHFFSFFQFNIPYKMKNKYCMQTTTLFIF